MSVGRAVERLMVLDGVLVEPEATWLGLARDKAAAFTTPPFQPGAGRAAPRGGRRRRAAVSGPLSDRPRAVPVGAPIIVGRSMRWGTAFEGGHESVASPIRATEWRFAEGSAGTGYAFRTYLLVANPDPSAAAELDVEFVRENGARVTKRYPVAPHSRLTVFVNDLLPGALGFAITVRSVNGVGVVAERAMYWNSMVEGHATIGATARSVTWWFAEGAQGTLDGLPYDTSLLVFNEDAQDLTVRADYVRDDGVTLVRTYTAPAGRRVSLWAGDVAELVGHRFSVTLTGTGPDGVTPKAFVAERGTYWGAGWYGGNGSLGVPRR